MRFYDCYLALAALLLTVPASSTASSTGYTWDTSYPGRNITVQIIFKFDDDRDRKTITSSKKAVFEISGVGGSFLFRPRPQVLSVWSKEGEPGNIATQEGDVTFEWSGCTLLGRNPRFITYKLLPERNGSIETEQSEFDQPRISKPPPTLSGTDYSNDEGYVKALRNFLESVGHRSSNSYPAYMNFATRGNKWEVSYNCNVSTPFTISLVKQGLHCPETYLLEDGSIRFGKNHWEDFIGDLKFSKVLPTTLERDASYYIVTDYSKRSKCRLEMHLLEAEASNDDILLDTKSGILPNGTNMGTNVQITTDPTNTGTKDKMASMLWTLAGFLGLIIAF